MIIACSSRSPAQERDSSEIWSFHFQFTGIGQYHGPFHADYSGPNSLSNQGESPFSVTATLFAGRRLWRGAEAYFNPEMSGGNGFSSTKGVAGFPNGEVYRVGDPKPKVSVARIFLRQSFSFGADDTEHVSPDQNQIAGIVYASRVTITVGRFALTDIFQNISSANDPRTQFMNWAIWGAGAWDYAADTRGYTWGLATQFQQRHWMLNIAAVMVPDVANGTDFDTHLNKAYSLNLEFVRRFPLMGREGTARILGFWNRAHMGTYRDAINLATATGKPPDITATRDYSSKYGFAIAVEQPVSKTLNTFARFSWNDGATESWVFTEIDRSIELGVSIQGELWKREQDNIGIAYVANALSPDHRDYLTLGGYGFIIGDGRLNYGLEQIVESYYSARLTSAFTLSLDNQIIINPAYNKDRGPVVDAIAIRGHVEF